MTKAILDIRVLRMKSMIILYSNHCLDIRELTQADTPNGVVKIR